MRIPGKATAVATQSYHQQQAKLGTTIVARAEWHISQVGFGSYRVTLGNKTHEQALRQALQSGINLIDTSSNYGDGNAERLIGRVLGEDTLARTQWFVEHYGAWMVVLVRLSPFLSNDAISLVAGVLRMDAMRFTLATTVGIVPLAVAIGYVGQHTETMATAFAWVSGVSLAILAGVVWLDRKRRAD